MRAIVCSTVVAFLSVLTTPTNASPRVHNLAPGFLQFWDKAKPLEPGQQVALFKREVLSSFPEFYDFKFDKWTKQGKNPDAELIRIFAEFSKTESLFKQKSDQISGEIEQSIKRFTKTFPDFKTDFDLYVIQSLGEMDAGTRRFAGKRHFIFGIDGMVTYHNFKNEIPFFHHELFHQYHDQKLADSEHGDNLYFALWGEGLATYASQVLNPDATMAELMLDMPEGLSSRCEKNLKFLAEDFITKMDSSSESDYETYFLVSSKNKKVPTRAGYYLGYLVHKELSKTYSLDQLASMKDPEQIKSSIKTALLKISKSSRGQK